MVTNVPEGYKQTDAGLIPDDWEVKRVGDICDFIVPGRNKPKKFEGDIPWITTPDLEDGRSVAKSRLGLCISIDEAKKVGSKIVPAGSVLMSCAGELGIVAFSDNEIVINQQLHAFIPSSIIDGLFLLNAIKAQKKYIDGIATKTAVPYINKDNCNSIPIPLPPLHEQKAIAQALSDADAAIAELDRLTTKKRNIKQGAMQQLLTGKKRLPGFSGEWEVKKLGDIGYFYSGGTPNTCNPSFYGGHIPWITSGDLNSRRVRSVDGRITQKGLENSSAKLVTPNTLLIALYGATAGITAISEINAAINQAVLAIILKNDCIEFFFYKLTSIKDWIIKTYTQGGQPNLSGNIVKCITLGIPTIEEQKAIAQVLSDMDTEIEALEQKRNKYKAIKQGMMQELLTGRTRLI
jgi:type I restriction enzyme S subunit